MAKRFKRAYEPPRARTPGAWGGAILLLGTLVAGLIGAAVLLWRSIDIESVLEPATKDAPAVEAVLPEIVLAAPTETAPWRAYLYESRHTDAFFPDQIYYEGLTAHWDSLLSAVGASVTRLSGAAAINSIPERELLVVPSAVCMDLDERQAIRRHADRGGHLLVSWALGARNEKCEWVGYDYLQSLSGAEAAGTMEERSPTYLAVQHGSVIAAGLQPGARVEVNKEAWITLRDLMPSVFWSDRVLNPLAAPGGGAAGAATAKTNQAGGRFVWFGYRLDVGASDRDQRLLDRLATNAALWTAGHLVADVDPWPDGYRAAMTVTQDVEHSFRNSQRLARRFSAIDVPVTFYVVTQLAVQNPELAPSLRAAGEVGSHSADHRQIAGRRWGTQLTGMWKARTDIAEWSGASPLGLRPPRELYDRSTLEAWGRLGGSYLAASNDARSAAPEIFTVRSGPIVVLPRVVDDDYTVMVTRGKNSSNALRDELQASLQKIRSLGGLHLLTLHSQLINNNRRIDAVEAVVNTAAAAGDVWIARAADIATWWLERSQLELRVQERADRSAVLTIANHGKQPVSSVWVHVYLPEARETYAAPEIGQTILESRFGPWGLRVKVPTLEPNTSLRILLPRHSSSAEPQPSIGS